SKQLALFHRLRQAARQFGFDRLRRAEATRPQAGRRLGRYHDPDDAEFPRSDEDRRCHLPGNHGDSDRRSDANADTTSATNPDSHSTANTSTNSDANTSLDSNAHTNTDPDANTNPDSNANTSPDSEQVRDTVGNFFARSLSHH